MTPDSSPSAIPSTGSAGRPPSHQASESGRHDPDGRGQHADRRRAQRVAGRLEPDVPGDVEKRADEDQGDDEGVHARTLPVEVPPLQAPRPDDQATERENGGDDDPDGIETTGHRLSEVPVQGQVEHGIRQVERLAERIEQERRDHEARRDGRRERCPDETAHGQTDPGEGRGGKTEHAHPEDGVDDVAGLRRDAHTDEDARGPRS